MSDDSEREQDIDRIKRALFDLRQKPFSFMRFEELVGEAMQRIEADWEAKTGCREILKERQANATAQTWASACDASRLRR